MVTGDAVCVDCGKSPPKTNTTYTLVSSAHGWRLSRTVTPAGKVEVVWRCRDCWKRFKDDAAPGARKESA